MNHVPHIMVDFSNQDDDDLVFARLARASEPLEDGDQVLVLDGEGNECYGRVARLENGMAYLALDWETWVDEDSPTRTGVAWETILELRGPSHGNGNTVAESESAPPFVLNF